ncbi:MAG TPA: ABC transporter ATP-binding protein [Ignavibacteria bacterium]|nr:ABC transporter ATP-binding protein [Ignavibacteria bacterium]
MIINSLNINQLFSILKPIETSIYSPVQSLEFRNISKNFGNFCALKNISLQIPVNSIYCLLGENGAGKSTLMKILAGVYQPDSGSIYLSGSEINFSSPHDAIDKGIGMIYQHFMLIEDFTVLENVILGNEFVKNAKIDFKKTYKILNDLIAKYNLNLDLKKKISTLSVGEQQKVEILKILYRNPDIIILDEPTAVLSPDEIKNLFAIIKRFKEENKTVILITHKLNEVKEISDYVSVLRRGELVFTSETKNLDIDKLAFEIIGEKFEISDFEKQIIDDESVLLEFLNVNTSSIEKNNLKNFSFNLNKYEIHGICGVEGNGQSELVDILAGLDEDFSGELNLKTKKISVVPDDRIKKGLIAEYDIPENIFIKSSQNIYNKSEHRDNSLRLISKYDIRTPDVLQKTKYLSGGNQQKVICAREIELGNDILVFYNPTRGIDIKATYSIQSKIIDERNKGKAVLLISSDIDELLSLSDRLSIIYRGEIIKTYEKNEFQNLLQEDRNLLQQEIGKLMIGIKLK